MEAYRARIGDAADIGASLFAGKRAPPSPWGRKRGRRRITLTRRGVRVKDRSRHSRVPSRTMRGASRLEYARRVNRVIDHVREHLGDELSLAGLARLAAFSPFHFHRVFRAVTGETAVRLHPAPAHRAGGHRPAPRCRAQRPGGGPGPRLRLGGDLRPGLPGALRHDGHGVAGGARPARSASQANDSQGAQSIGGPPGRHSEARGRRQP